MSKAPNKSVSRTLTLAELTTVQFHKLLDRNPEELEELMHACRDVGFFYLDLTEPSCGPLFHNLRNLTEIMEEWFAQPTDVKLETPTVSSSHGYKATGTHAGVGQGRDGWEALKIGRSELSGHWALPPVVNANIGLFSDFQAQCHFVTKVLLDCISKGLGLTGNSNLHEVHRDDAPSKSSLFYLHYPPMNSAPDEQGQNQHTDIGSLTLLFTCQWGLQVLCPTAAGTLEWQFVEPKPGHAIINVGDTLRFLSGFKLRSALHRALPLDNDHRYSVAYFLRPNDLAEFVDINGETASAVDWYLTKNRMYERPAEAQDVAVLTGGLL